MRTDLTLAISFLLLAAATSPRAQRPAPVERTGGYAVVSPSVASSSAIHRDAGGPAQVDVLILWRGSPGWMYRRTRSGSSSTGGGPNRDGTTEFSSYQGGLHLTAKYDPATQTVDVLGERVPLKGGNVVLVDRVDAPDGPVVVKTTTVAPMALPVFGVGPILRNTPELLDYLRCEQQIPGGLSHPSMAPVCADAILKGAVKAAAVMNEIPAGPVTNRAAAVAPAPPPRETPPPGATSSSSQTLSGSVVGGWFLHMNDAGAYELDLLVLWRGTSGWPLQGASGFHGGGNGTARQGMTARRGNLSLYAAYDVSPRRYTIENDTKPLGDDNVVLVDDVDSANGPRVVKTLRVDPVVPDNGRVDQLIARSPELVAYLGCDAKPSEPQKQVVVDILCSRYAGK